MILTQTGEMRADAAHDWARFRARQSIAVDRIGFVWRAATGPLGSIRVTDALDDAGPRITVTAFGVLSLARVARDAALTKGELQRYLAELPLAPDAILHNPELGWEVMDASRLRVSAIHRGVHAHVDLTLNADGLVASAFAPDRPRLEGGAAIERPWEGRFTDYRAHHGRTLPFAAEVAWSIDGQRLSVWRGAMRTWGLANAR